ncbi:L-sorbosone dehydrogenase [Pseudomonas aeruginosa]|nr:L-sorbosone dehydrogenase [Pseudomonas aeruginosa]
MASLHSLRPVALALGLVLAGCNQGSQNDPQQQTGANPALPEPKHFLLPPMKVPEGVGWSGEAKPTVAQGLKIEKIADGLQHPRQLLVLPNGDVLVVEANSPGTAPVTTPKQLIAGMVKGQSGKAGKGGNRITLLRRAGAEGQWQKYVFLEGLDSPFGVQRVGDYLYVANTGNIMRYRYVPGENPGRRPGDGVHRPAGHHQPPLDQGAARQSRRAQALRGRRFEQQHHRERRGDRIPSRGDSRGWTSPAAAAASTPPACANPTGLQWEPVSGKLWTIVNERDEIGNDLVPDYLTSVREGGFYGWPTATSASTWIRGEAASVPTWWRRPSSPDYALGSHVAALGLFFYTGNELPSAIATAPSSASTAVGTARGQRLPGGPCAVRRRQARRCAAAGGDRVRLRGREAIVRRAGGLAQAADGALLIADDVGNAIWRVSAAGTD